MINGFSKSHAMTGWRLGYACGPRVIIEQMLKIHQFAIMCAPSTSQYAGVEATTAVSVGSQVMHMLTVMIVGLAMGTTVSIAQSVGAKDHARTAVGTDRTD